MTDCWMTDDLNAERLDALFATQMPHKDRARHVDGCKKIDDEAKHERDGEAANRPCAEDEEKQRRDDRRHVRIYDRHKGAPEPLLDSRRDGLAGAQLLAYALEDKHVRVHG